MCQRLKGPFKRKCVKGTKTVLFLPERRRYGIGEGVKHLSSVADHYCHLWITHWLSSLPSLISFLLRDINQKIWCFGGFCVVWAGVPLVAPSHSRRVQRKPWKRNQKGRLVAAGCWWRKERREKAEIVFWNLFKGSIVQANWNDIIQEDWFEHCVDKCISNEQSVKYFI